MKPHNQKIFYYLILSIILAVHLYGVIIFLPPVDQFFSGEPIYHADYLLHFYQVHAARHYLSDSFRTWGYDPHLMAGYPGNAIYDVGYKLCELLVPAFSFLGLARAYNLFISITFLLPPPADLLGGEEVQPLGDPGADRDPPGRSLLAYGS
jgi:hypothetical protein